MMETKIQLTLPVLTDGQLYAGIVTDKDGNPTHHLVLLPGDIADSGWNESMDWAGKAGGDLPTRQELHLLLANLKGKFKSDWYWSNEQDAGLSSFAWLQYFGDGDQNYGRKSYLRRACVVRRLVID